MGNGQVQRFNKTLLQMLGALQESQESDWKAHVPTLAIWPLPAMPHFMTTLGFYRNFLCLGATLGWPLMPSLV